MKEEKGWCTHCYRLLDKREDGRPVLHTDTRGKLCYGVSSLAISTYPGGGKPPCEWEIPATTVVTVPTNPATLALWGAFYDKHDEMMRLRRVLALAARGELPRCYSCLHLATQWTERSGAHHQCDACVAEHVALFPEVAGWYRDLPHADVLREVTKEGKEREEGA